MNARERIVLSGARTEWFAHRDYRGVFIRPAHRIDPTPASFGDTVRDQIELGIALAQMRLTQIRIFFTIQARAFSARLRGSRNRRPAARVHGGAFARFNMPLIAVGVLAVIYFVAQIVRAVVR